MRLPSPAAERAVLVGVALMLVGDLMFALNDAMGKWLVSTYSPGQLMLIRSFAALVVLAPFVLAAGPATLVRIERPGLQAGRVLASTADSVLFYAAVVYLPVADVMTFYLAAPIYVAALSPFLLGERVGWRRWLAIVVGFIGVVIALRPSASTISYPAIISLIGSIAFALAMIASRALRGTPDRTLVFWQTVGGLVAGAVLAPYGWVTPTLAGFSLLALLGIVAMAAHILINRSLKYAPATTLAPIQYTLLLWAILFGYLFFGDVPEPMMLVGAAIIVVSGLFIFLREKQRRIAVAAGPLDPR